MSEKLTFEQLKNHLWAAADILRGSLDASEFRQPIMSLLFLKRINDQFEERAEKLEKSVKKYSKKIGVETIKISIKNQRNRWGSLSKKGTLNFNQNLIRAPSKIIDYVAAHEVCHMKIPNHSREYWRLLESVMPDYKERKDWLRVNRTLFFD